uniref:Uncharacterized protein n=1 Tax=Arundo donax TaxID=35708 RepID=A0A0A9AIB6_ARUDO
MKPRLRPRRPAGDAAAPRPTAGGGPDAGADTAPSAPAAHVPVAASPAAGDAPGNGAPAIELLQLLLQLPVLLQPLVHGGGALTPSSSPVHCRTLLPPCISYSEGTDKQ